MLFGAKGATSAFVINYDRTKGVPIDELALGIHERMASRRRQKVAIFGDMDMLKTLLSPFDAEYLDPSQNYHWTGIQRRAQKHWKRTLMGEYEAWFEWYMQWRRFKTFDIVVFIEPLSAVAVKEYGGYIDGLLARVAGKASQIIIVTSEVPQATIERDIRRTKEVLLSLLYGTRASYSELIASAVRTLVQIKEDDVREVLSHNQSLIQQNHSRYHLTGYAEKFVQGMEPPRPLDEDEVETMNQIFARRRRTLAAKLKVPDVWLREKAIEDAKSFGWITVSKEEREMNVWLERLARDEDYKIQQLFSGYEDLDLEESRRALAPPRSQVRRVLEALAADGHLSKTTWFQEVGRPSAAYFLPSGAPFLKQRCGQCAFYVSLRRRCRLWWLVDVSHGRNNPRWNQSGSKVSPFEVHKMINSRRIGPHSSACLRFVDKKRDHFRKAVPPSCEVCSTGLSKVGSASTTCKTCGTCYIRIGARVKVLTSYSHEFQRLYGEIAGTDPNQDFRIWKEDQAQRIPQLLENTMEFDAVENELPDEEADYTPPQWHRPSIDEVLQAQVNSLSKSTDIPQQLSTAMVKSALNATTRIASIARLAASTIDPIKRAQELYLLQLKARKRTDLLTFEALAMKQYWLCYDFALVPSMQWFGPRKKARFVREYAAEPTGRARGYSAIDAAINYLHQRRLGLALRINSEVGFGERCCDGFLHKERHNSRGMGLALDIIDPFKFADREALLAVVLNRGITWRDFRIETDRRGSTFYYPSRSAIVKLNRVGLDADEFSVGYLHRMMPLNEAYRAFAANLHELLTLQDQTTLPLNPFVYTLSDGN